jgi:RluA family pseudouridine synthase
MRVLNMPEKKRFTNRNLPRGLKILYEDKDLLVVDKPAGLLTVRTKTEKTRTAHCILTDYVRKGDPRSRNQIITVHRLDQWTSGVLIFAKSEKVKLLLQAQWKDTEKKYIAVAHGQFSQKEGIIASYLAEDKAFVVYSTTDAAKGRFAQTAYKVLKETRRFSMLEVTLLSGRKNQIRVHLADKHHPVVGDRKYGKTGDGYERLALHSKSISFKHPITRQQMTFETILPGYFERLMAE